MFTHVDENNKPQMVDIGHKEYSHRHASAQSVVMAPEEVMRHFRDGEIVTKKGPVFQTAIIAGTMAVKKTAELIPFCHALPIESCDIDISVVQRHIRIECRVSTYYKTGVEMEALYGATAAALTIYDMCKALSQEIRIEGVELLQKSGGQHDYLKAT